MNPAFDIAESSLYERSREELISIILRLQSAVRSRDADLKYLIKQLEWHKRQLFGLISEKRVIYDVNADLVQPELFT